MKNKFTRLFVYTFISVLIACTNRPSHVLSETKMEDVLFDLYIVEAEIRDNNAVSNNDSIKKQLYQSVFKKHRTSEQKFDTSLVWYNAHLNKYMKINNRLTERYDHLIVKLQAEVQWAERKAGSRLKFEDLGLEDFLSPLLFSSFQENESDSIPNDTLRNDTIRNYILRDDILINDTLRNDTIKRIFRMPVNILKANDTIATTYFRRRY